MVRRTSKSDSAFRFLTLVVATSLVAIALFYFYELVNGSRQNFVEGLGFITGSIWDPVNNVFGALPSLYGSLITSAIALVIGVPVSLGVAVFLSELSPGRLRSPLSFVVEMLAAVPSVVYGIWGLFVLAPLLRVYAYPFLGTYLGFLPIFSCPNSISPCQYFGVSIFSAGIILSIMIIPIVSSISRDALQAVPNSQREAAFALGATKSEMVNLSVLSYARSGIVAAVFLGFGRAFGETMAVTFLIGNTPLISQSILSPGYTLASLIANEFTEATTSIYRSALIEAGLLLLVVSFATSLAGRVLVRRFVKNREAASYL